MYKHKVRRQSVICKGDILIDPNDELQPVSGGTTATVAALMQGHLLLVVRSDLPRSPYDLRQ